MATAATAATAATGLKDKLGGAEDPTARYCQALFPEMQAELEILVSSFSWGQSAGNGVITEPRNSMHFKAL